MISSHIALDHVLLVLFALIGPLVDWLWLYPLLMRRSAAGVPGARPRAYLVNLLITWGFTACVLALWAVRGRPWSALLLGSSTPLRLGLGLALAALYAGLALAQRRTIVARPERLARLRGKFGTMEALLPRTPGERRGFAAVSITAGICEEILYRGYALWYAAVWISSLWIARGWAGAAWTVPTLAVVISSILFGYGHIYLGAAHFVKTAVVGLVFGVIVLAAGSLWPAIIIHAVMDLLAGDLAYHSFAAGAGNPNPSAPAADPGPTAPASA